MWLPTRLRNFVDEYRAIAEHARTGRMSERWRRRRIGADLVDGCGNAAIWQLSADDRERRR